MRKWEAEWWKDNGRYSLFIPARTPEEAQTRLNRTGRSHMKVTGAYLVTEEEITNELFNAIIDHYAKLN